MSVLWLRVILRVGNKIRLDGSSERSERLELARFLVNYGLRNVDEDA